MRNGDFSRYEEPATSTRKIWDVLVMGRERFFFCCVDLILFEPELDEPDVCTATEDCSSQPEGCFSELVLAPYDAAPASRLREERTDKAACVEPELAVGGIKE